MTLGAAAALAEVLEVHYRDLCRSCGCRGRQRCGSAGCLGRMQPLGRLPWACSAAAALRPLGLELTARHGSKPAPASLCCRAAVSRTAQDILDDGTSAIFLGAMPDMVIVPGFALGFLAAALG